MNINDGFEGKIKASLDTQVQGLDADTRQQLAAARRKALNQLAKRPWRDYLLPAGSLALCSLLAVFILINPKPNIAPTNVAPNSTTQLYDQVAALELLDNVDDIDTATDPDFYLWADEILATEGKAHSA